MAILNDRPIAMPEADAFGRNKFAEAIANALVLPPGAPSIAVAVEGEWGSGKTSVLNMAATHLERHQEQPLVIQLNSWLLAGSETVIQTFLTQFAAALGKDSRADQAEAVAEKVLRFSRLLAPVKLIPGADSWATLILNGLESVGEGAKAYAALSKLDVQKMKQEVAEELRKTGRSIVVVLDDIDRLDPAETRQIFRLVKAVADFERVAYLLAYDPSPVHQALSFGGTYDGEAYLEKIIQVAYPLPLPGYWPLKAYLESRLRNLLEKHDLKDFEENRFGKLLTEGGLGHVLRHPRDVNRLVNRLSISLPATRGEVNAADVIAFEALAVRYSRVAQNIRKRPYEFVGGRTLLDEPLLSDYLERLRGGSTGQSKKDIPPWRRQLWEDLPLEEQKPLLALLDFLFPGFAAASLFNSATDEEMESDLRICRRIPLLKLLAVGPMAGGPSAREVSRFLTDTTNREAILDDIYQSDSPYGWLTFAANFLNRTSVEAPEELAGSLLRKAAQLTEVDRVSAYGFIEEMSFFALRFMRQIPSSDAQKVFRRIAASAESLSLSHDVVLQVARDHGLWSFSPEKSLTQKIIINERDVAEEGVRLWLSVVREASISFESVLKEPAAIGILFRWGQFASYAEVQEAVEKFTATTEGVQIFLNSWLPGHGMSDFHLFFKDWRSFRDRCNSHPGRSSFRSELWGLFEALEAKEPVRQDMSGGSATTDAPHVHEDHTGTKE